MGSIVTWARSGVGAVATQANVDPSYGPLGLELMSKGRSAGVALSSLMSHDRKAEVRQVAMVDARGLVAAHTGSDCIPEAGHISGEGFSCQGNIMKSRRVWDEMAKEFEASSGAPLADRLMASLEAGQKAGGDLRGVQSAAMVVVGARKSPRPWEGRITDVRVDDSPEPLKELRRLVRYNTGYNWMNRGDDLLSSNKIREASLAYMKGLESVPEVLELRYWVAIGLLSSGRSKARALKMLREICAIDPSWINVTEGIVKIQKPRLDPSVLEHLR